jgi:hypothetical protein
MSKLGFVLLAAGFLACGGSGSYRAPQAEPVSGPGYWPLSRQVTFVESTTTGETMLRATGKGDSVASAIADAKKAAVWFVLYAGDRPFLKSPLQQSGSGDFEKRLFKNVDAFIRYQSELKGKRQIGGVLHADILVRLDVGAVGRALAAAGVRPDTGDLLVEVGLPTLAVAAKDAAPEARTAVATMLEYLQDRGFEVYDLSAARTQNAMIERLAALDGVVDPTFGPAINSGSDILIRVGVSVSSDRRHGSRTMKASVSVTASEVASQKLVGSTTGHSPERVVSGAGGVVHEAANDAADKITSQIRSSWIKQQRTGRAFKVVLQTGDDPEGSADSAMYAALKSLSGRSVKRQSAGSGLSVYLLHLRDVENAFELYDALKTKWPGSGTLSKVHDAGAFLIVRTNNEGGVEIEIEHTKPELGAP